MKPQRKGLLVIPISCPLLVDEFLSCAAWLLAIRLDRSMAVQFRKDQAAMLVFGNISKSTQDAFQINSVRDD